MSMRYQAGIVLPGYNALKVANAPTIGTATAGNSLCVSVTFTAPSCVGGGAISSYTVFSNCGTKTISGASSPLVVTGLTASTAYTFKVVATNIYGPSYPSAASNSATPAVVGQQAYTTSGTYSWVAPTGVTSVSIVAVGSGANGGYGDQFFQTAGGGGLGYKNNYSVTPGNSYTVVVGAKSGSYPGAGANSYFVNTSTVRGGGGSNGNSGAGGLYNGDGGGNGGDGGGARGGGGGAGGYSAAGGKGGGDGAVGIASTGGGGGGGNGGDITGCCRYAAGGGGGVGILGAGANGAAGGGAGSGGTAGGPSNAGFTGGAGGTYGGGGGSGGVVGCSGTVGGLAGGGAVRIIWPGTTRSFPSTNTGNL